jgi:hypothetical protein
MIRKKEVFFEWIEIIVIKTTSLTFPRYSQGMTRNVVTYGPCAVAIEVNAASLSERKITNYKQNVLMFKCSILNSFKTFPSSRPLPFSPRLRLRDLLLTLSATESQTPPVSNHKPIMGNIVSFPGMTGPPGLAACQLLLVGLASTRVPPMTSLHQTNSAISKPPPLRAGTSFVVTA